MKEARSTTRVSKVTVPEKAHPLAKLVFTLMRDQAVTYDDLEWRSGVLRSTFKAWRTSNLPSVPTLDAALGVLGWNLTAAPKAETLEPALLADLADVAKRHGIAVLTHRELLAASIGYEHSGSHIDARTRFVAPGKRLAA